MKKSIVVLLSLLMVSCAALGTAGLFNSLSKGKKEPENKEYKVTYKYYLDNIEMANMPVNKKIENTDLPEQTEVEQIYSFDSYKCSNGVSGSWNDKEWKFEPSLTSNTVCKLYFVSNMFDVKVNVVNGILHELTEESNKMVKKGESISYSITPTEGYTLEKAECDNGATPIWTPETNTLAVNNITAKTTCEIAFKISGFTSKVTVNGGAVVEQPQSANYGESITYTINPNPGYVFDKVTCTNGQTSSFDQASNKLTISNLSKDTECVVSFKINNVNVKINIANGNLLNATPDQSVTHGSNITCGLVANSGYKLDGATVSCTNGIQSSITGNLLMINSITADTVCTITLPAE